MKRSQKSVLKLHNSPAEALEILEIECRKAILEAMRKGIIPCARWKDNATSTANDRKEIGKSD